MYKTKIQGSYILVSAKAGSLIGRKKSGPNIDHLNKSILSSQYYKITPLIAKLVHNNPESRHKHKWVIPTVCHPLLLLFVFLSYRLNKYHCNINFLLIHWVLTPGSCFSGVDDDLGWGQLWRINVGLCREAFARNVKLKLCIFQDEIIGDEVSGSCSSDVLHVAQTYVSV